MAALRILPLAAALLMAGCTSMAPRYERPAAPLPAQYEGGAAAGTAQAAAALDWPAYFNDPALQQLITLALGRNADLRTAVLRVQEAQAAYGLQRSERFPAVGLSADASRARTPADLSLSGSAVTANRFQAGLSISSWELDLWGRVASLNDVALQRYLATDAACRAATAGLIAQVADAYLDLREFDERLRLAQESATSQRESLRISTRRFEVGAASRLELTQVQTLVTQAESLVVQLRQQREQQAHALEVLLGGPAELLPPPSSPAQADAAWQLPALAAGLPSELLLQRPDLLAAEHELRAANAQIGAARAAFFPSIRLTAFGGTASSELDGLFKGSSRAWSFTPSLTLPIFDAGRNQSNLELAEVRRHLAVVQYEQAVQIAFREVADALSARRWLGEQVRVQHEALLTQRERARLSRLSYDHGASSFLDVLDAERSLISATQQWVQTRRALLSSQVALYRALGGGSPQAADALPPSSSSSATAALR